MTFRITRWSDPSLLSELEGLLAEAQEAGVHWMERFAPEWQRRPFLDQGEGLFLAMRGDVPAAMAVISKDGLAPDPDTGRLRYIFVSTATRRQGMAEALVRAALEVADQRWRRVTLHTDNPVAAALYLRHGFTLIDGTARTTHERLNPTKQETAPQGAAL
jgi:ribosomal protein S18 acetylase RimI-like enzyme